MAALTAVVTSGSPSASLRKTRGPGKGGVNEVFSSKRASGATTPSGMEKQVRSGGNLLLQFLSACLCGNGALWGRQRGQLLGQSFAAVPLNLSLR